MHISSKNEEEQEYFKINFSYMFINKEKEANKVLSHILKDKGSVIGVDIEAAVEMSRFGILCLIQISYKDIAYIFDMTEINHKSTLLSQVFADPKITKVFHDCTEDCSLLFNIYNIRCQNIFDTQIAHRMCYEDLHGSSINTKHSSISLNDLLKEYFKLNNEIKSEIQELMKNDPYFWKKRPISEKMLEYSANDVLYLPKIHEIVKKLCDDGIYPSLSINNIKKESIKYLDYSEINLTIKNFNKINIQKDKEIKGLLKNIQKHCVFIQLNIGYNGIITNKKSIYTLATKFKVGDILIFKVIKLDDEKKRYILDLSEKQDGKKEKSQSEKENSESKPKIKSLNVNVSAYYPSSMKQKQLINTSSINENDLNEQNFQNNQAYSLYNSQLASFLQYNNNNNQAMLLNLPPSLYYAYYPMYSIGQEQYSNENAKSYFNNHNFDYQKEPDDKFIHQFEDYS